MQQWWQNKYIWACGLLGSILMLLTPFIGVLNWPVYAPLKQMSVILTARDQPFRTLFVGYNLVASLLIVVFLWAWVQFGSYKRLTRQRQAVLNLLGGFIVLQILRWGFPLVGMAQLSSVTDRLNWYILLLLVVDVGLAGLVLRVGQSYDTELQPSLTNMWRLSSGLMLIFIGALLIIQLLGWPFAGAFDELINFMLLWPIMYTSWDFVQKTWQ